MKLLSSAMLFLAATAIHAAPFLDWQYPSGVGQDGFRVYCGPNPAQNPTPVSVGATARTYDAAALPQGVEHECWVTAYRNQQNNNQEESAESNHVVFMNTPPVVEVLLPPIGLRMVGTVFHWDRDPDSAPIESFIVNCGSGDVATTQEMHDLVTVPGGQMVTCRVRSVTGGDMSDWAPDYNFTRLLSPSEIIIRWE